MWFSETAGRLSKVFYPITRYLNVAGLVFLALMMLLTTADVIGRYIFNTPLTGAFELTEFMMAVVIAFGLSYTQVKKGHVNVDVVTEKLSKRVQAVINSITCLMFLCLFVLISWRLILYAERLRLANQTSASLYIPVFPFIDLVALGGIILCLVLVADLLGYLAEATKGKRWWSWTGLLILVAMVVFIFSLPVWGQGFLFKLDPIVAGYAGIGLLIVMLFSGMPVGVVMALVGFLGIAYVTGINPALTSIGTTPYSTAASYSMSVVPLFILMGAFTYYAGMTKELYDTAQSWLGRLPGGLALATIGASAAFAAVSGSSVAATATIGMVALPEMKKYKYGDMLSTASIAAGGGLAIMIPPSTVLVIYGILTETSIGKLLLAGFVPGIILSLLYMLAIYIWCLIDPQIGPKGPKTTFIQKIKSFKDTWAVFGLFVLVMGGLYAGLFTPTEGAGIGAFGAFAIGLIRRRLKWKGFVDSLKETMETSAMVFVILIGANIFGYFLTVSRVPNELSAVILNLEVSPNIIMVVILLIYLFLGCIMSSLAMIVLTIPIFFPIVVALGFDPIWFGIIIVLVVEMGQLTPPVGINVYIIHGIAKTVPMYTIFKGIVPFLFAQFVLTALLMAWPQIATFVPSMMK
jgi:C4-dicarboxylate transporter DctM subunit